MKQRDTQRAKLYACEAVLSKYGDGRHESVRDMVRYSKRVWRSKRLHAKYPRMGAEPPRIEDGRGHRSAKGGMYELTMPRWSRSEHVLCHEISHCITQRQFGRQVAGHGREYCAVYLNVVLYMLGREAHNALKASMKAHGVRFRPKKQRAPLSPERRAKLIATLAEARAKRQVTTQSQTELGFGADWAPA